MRQLFQIMRFLKPYAGRLAAAFLLLLVSSGVMLAQPRLAELAVDLGVSRADTRVVLLAALVVLLSAAVSSLVLYSSGVLMIRSSQRAGYDMRNSLFARVTSFSFANFDSWRTGELMVRLNSDVNLVVMFFRMGFFMIAQAALILAGAVVLMFLTNARLAAVLTAIMVGVFLLFLLFSRVLRPLFLRVRGALDRLNNTLQESLAGAKLVRAFSRQETEKEKFGERNQDFYSLSLRAGVIIGFMMPFLMLVGNLTLLAVLRVGGGAVDNGVMTLGQLAAFNNYALMAVFPILMLAMVLNFMAMASASAGRIAAILGTEPGLVEKPAAEHLPALTGRIDFEDVCFHYGDGQDALQGITLSIEPGQHVGIIGTTGSGKSTLVNLIPRFYDVISGAVRLDRRDVRDLSFATVRGRVAAVLQETVLFSGTIAENIRFGRPEATLEEVQEAARAACAEEFILEKEKQWDEPVGERGMGLSGGQRQRVAIARALLSRPDILILDDVTSALDLQTESQVIENLYGGAHSGTTIIVSQKVNAVRRADRILVLSDGRIEAAGRHEELMSSSAVYREIARTQSPEAVEARDE